MERALKELRQMKRNLQDSPVTRPPDGVGGDHAGENAPSISSGNVGHRYQWHLDEMSTIKEMQQQFVQKFYEMDEKIEKKTKEMKPV